MDCPFRISVFDKTFAPKGWVGDPLALTARPQHNGLGTVELTVASSHRRLPNLVAKGARLVVEYDGEHLLSGPVRLKSGQGPLIDGTVTVVVQDDWRVLANVLGWPVPSAALTAQNVAYDTRTAPAETVVKQVLSANAVTRLGLPITVAPDLGRGAAVSVSFRMHPLADRLLPAVDQAGIGITVRQQDAGLLVDVYEPADAVRLLSEASGVVQNWKWSAAGPTATRVVAGDQGEAASRSFTQTIDAAREDDWGDVIEVFQDARDTSDPAMVTARRLERLADGAPKNGLTVTLAETGTFRYGRAVRIGDQVALEVGPGVLVQDVLREAVLSWTRDDGLVVTPVVGDRSDDPDSVLARAVARIARGLRRQDAER